MRGIGYYVLYFQNTTLTRCAVRLSEMCNDYILHDWIATSRCYNQTKPWLYQNIQIYNKQLCTNTQFVCHDKTCILKQYSCDGETDCPDNSDEYNCSSNIAFFDRTCTNKYSKYSTE